LETGAYDPDDRLASGWEVRLAEATSVVADNSNYTDMEHEEEDGFVTIRLPGGCSIEDDQLKAVYEVTGHATIPIERSHEVIDRWNTLSADRMEQAFLLPSTLRRDGHRVEIQWVE